ncbi:tetratricopeptide repeat protein [Parabacteroides sp. AM08-6]|uniref:tetratricopeptide repeat protein n=1 Tax=Parabacteroides sp. AM08-6 TaxID=2292053 RepID=UPI001F1E9ECA|nr:tetratricopeptide repeat protein [Parabacteroides sp. AM08-6]
MKRHLQQIILQVSIVFILIILSCCAHLHTTPELTLAEQLMEQKPDSSLIILEGIENPDKLSEREHALYCLLLTLAQDKNYVTHQSDSLIQIATKYFEKHKEHEYAMLAYYSMGRVNTDLQDALQAQECYLKALELGENSKNNHLLVKIYSNLGTLYAYQDINDMALPMYKQALRCAEQEQMPDSLNISFIYRNIARTFSQTQQLDSAILYYKKAIKYSVPINISSILVDLGNLYYDKNNFIEAEKYINNAEKLTNIKNTLLPIYLSKGRILIEKGELDSAKYYLALSSQSENIYTKSASFRRLAQISLKEEKYIDYAKFSEQHEALRDSIINCSHFENIRITQSMFDYQRIAKERNMYEKKASERKILIYQITIFSVIIFIICIIFFKREQKRKKRQLEVKGQQYKRSQQYIEDNKRQIAQLEKNLSSEQVQKDEVTKQLFEARKAMLEIENIQIIQKQGVIQVLEKDFQNSNLYLRIHREENIQLTSGEWVELQNLIDSTYSGFTSRLIKEYNKITIDEIRICYLVKMKVPCKKISSIMHISVSGVSQCRRRLYKKFTNEPESTENFDKFIADF